MKKVTIAVSINNEPKITALMNHIGFFEVDRVASGGMMSSEFLMVTYEGESSKYNEDFFIGIPKGEKGTEYFSLIVVEGYTTREFEEFLTHHNDRKQPDFEILSFNAKTDDNG